ncbi:acyltransferase [Yoonia maritima]|uniref:acyltransferase n=1 Tax=Yoonia maritima TaxID=1435347 RepID=UPI0023B8259D|nr:acyltransferase [Yoonia maritima]
MRRNPIAVTYWCCRAVAAVYRRVGIVVATLMHRATLKRAGRGSRFQSGVRFADPSSVSVGRDCYFWRGCDVSSERRNSQLVIGNKAQINRDVHLDITGGLNIGDGVTISENVVVYTHDHGLDPHSTAMARPKTIEADVWIGMRAVILPQCQNIGRGAVIGAGAIVTRDVPAYAVVVGNPARPIRQRLPVAQEVV